MKSCFAYMKEKTQFWGFVTLDAKTCGKGVQKHRIGLDMPPELSLKMQKRQPGSTLRVGWKKRKIE